MTGPVLITRSPMHDYSARHRSPCRSPKNCVSHRTRALLPPLLLVSHGKANGGGGEEALCDVHHRANTGPGACSAGTSLLMLSAHPPRRPPPCNRTATFAPAHTQHHEIMFDPGITSLERHLKDREWENLAVAELHALRMEVAPIPEDLSCGRADADEGYINDAARTVSRAAWRNCSP